jgi:hypothetical protein
VTALSLDDVVALNALIVTAIGLSLAFGLRDKKRGPLDLGAPKRPTAADELRSPIRKSSNLLSKARAARGAPSPSPANSYGANALDERGDRSSYAARQLNVFFNWNGHTWDAYEVLGVPAGSSRETVIQAFHSARSKSPDSIAFLQAAADAILKSN